MKCLGFENLPGCQHEARGAPSDYDVVQLDVLPTEVLWSHPQSESRACNFELVSDTNAQEPWMFWEIQPNLSG